MATHKAIILGGAAPAGASAVRTYEPIDSRDEAVHCAWFAHQAGLAALPKRSWLVEERPQWDEMTGPGITRFSFLRRTADIERDEFAHRWDRHVALARRHHPALRRYVQNIVVDPDSDIDGIVELGFESLEDLELRMYDSEEGRTAIAADVRTFIDVAAGWRVITRDPE